MARPAYAAVLSATNTNQRADTITYNIPRPQDTRQRKALHFGCDAAPSLKYLGVEPLFPEKAQAINRPRSVKSYRGGVQMAFFERGLKKQN
jgi:hypothetical protein